MIYFQFILRIFDIKNYTRWVFPYLYFIFFSQHFIQEKIFVGLEHVHPSFVVKDKINGPGVSAISFLFEYEYQKWWKRDCFLFPNSDNLIFIIRVRDKCLILSFLKVSPCNLGKILMKHLTAKVKMLTNLGLWSSVYRIPLQNAPGGVKFRG